MNIFSDSRAVRNLFVASVAILCFLATAAFIHSIVVPAILIGFHEREFQSLSVECGVALVNAGREMPNIDSFHNDQLRSSRNVELVACHRLRALAYRLLRGGVSNHYLREIFIRSMEDDKLPLWVQAEPPNFPWER